SKAAAPRQVDAYTTTDPGGWCTARWWTNAWIPPGRGGKSLVTTRVRVTAAPGRSRGPPRSAPPPGDGTPKGVPTAAGRDRRGWWRPAGRTSPPARPGRRSARARTRRPAPPRDGTRPPAPVPARRRRPPPAPPRAGPPGGRRASPRRPAAAPVATGRAGRAR